MQIHCGPRVPSYHRQGDNLTFAELFCPLLIRAQMKMFKGDTVISGFQWLPEQGTNMTVLHVASKTMKRFRCSENFFAFHTVNMYVTLLFR